MTAGTVMVPVVRVIVEGRARTKGSMQTKQTRRVINGVSYGVGHARLVESTAHSKEWRAEVAWRVRQGLRSAGPVSGPVRVVIMSFLPRPKSNRDPMPTAKRTGDMDKIDRNVLDALTDAGAIVDDSQVVDLCSAKRWAADPAHPYTVIEVEAYPKESS